MADAISGDPGHGRVELKKKLVDGSKGAVHLAVVTLKVAASAAQNVPYLGAISTVLEEVMKIMDEVDVCKATWKAVMSEIQAIHTLVDTFRTQWTRKEMQEEELPGLIKKAFSEFEVCLLTVIVTMDKCKTKSKSSTDRLHLLAKRSEITATANQCEKDVVSALRMFQATLQIDQWNLQIDQRNLEMDQSKSINDLTSAVMPHAPLIANLNSMILTFILPPPPSIFYGCSGEVQDVVDLIVNPGPTHVAIVGSGGIGKTSIALTAMHHPKVENDFLHQRFFLSCEAIFTADTLALELLKLFGLSVESSSSRSPSDTLKLYMQAMTSKCLLCLDNFETPWDSDKDAVESLLGSIAVHHLTIIITSRDLDRPRGIKWGVLKPIQPLTLDAAIETWDAISQGHDDFSVILIKAVDCIPLAVTLLAQLAEVESSEALWASWNSESTRLVKSDGSVHRLNNLELSIELSLHGPRLHACLGALDFFTVLCMLPQGMPESRISDFETAFAKDFTGLRSVIRVLKQCSLVYLLDGFLHVLSPIRQYMQSHPSLSTVLSKTLFTQMANYYLNLIPVDDSHINSSAVHKAVQLEISNISAMLDLCLAQDTDLQRVLHRTIRFSKVCQYLAVYDTRLLVKAASIAHDFSPGLEGDCYFEQGVIYWRISHLSGAENMFKAALDIHREVGDRAGQANDLQGLGQLHQRLDHLEDAEKALNSALSLHKEVNSRSGQAYDLKALGELYQRLNRLGDAEKALQSALNLHKEVNSRLGQANDLQALGELYQMLNRLENAEQALNSALNLHKEVNSRIGQAYDLTALGALYQRLNRLKDAEKALQSALDLHIEVNDRLGQANDLQALGALYQRLNRLEDAEQALNSALNLHKEVNSRISQAYDLRALGALYQRLNQLKDAEQALQSALSLHKEANDRLGQANDLKALGVLYRRLNRLEDAEQALQSALNLHKELNDRLGQANDLKALGELYQRLDRLEDAEQALQSALDFHRNVNSRLGQANDLQALGKLYMKLDRLKDAEQALQSALNIHTEFNSSLGQGNALYELGKLCTTQHRFSKAENFLTRAKDAYRRAQEPQSQKYIQDLLEDLHQKREEQPDVAEEDSGDGDN